MLQQFSINRLIVLFVSASFAFLTIDSLIEHWSVLGEETTAYIPVIFSAIGALYSLIVALRWQERCIKNLQIFLLASVLVSFGGLYFHLAEENEEEATTEQIEHEQAEKDKPPLAPLAFSGVAMFGMLGTLRKWQAEVK